MAAQPTNDYEAAKATCHDLRLAIKSKRTEYNDQILKEQSQSTTSPLPELEFHPIRIFKGHYGKVYDLDWTDDSSLFCSASQDGNLLIWNPYTGTKKLGIRLQSSWVMTCAYSPAPYRLIAVGGLDNLCSIYEVDDPGSLESSMPISELQRHEGYLSCCRFVSEDSILTASGDSTCILWDIESKTPKSIFYDHTGDVMTVAPCPNQKEVFLSGACDASAKTWDSRVGEKSTGTFTGHESDVNDVSWFPDYNAFGSGSDDSTCRFFDLRAYRQLHVYTRMQTAYGVTSVSFSSSGRLLVAGYDEEPFCAAWDTLYADIVSKLVHNNRVSCLGTSPNGGGIATGSWDQMLRLWVGTNQ